MCHFLFSRHAESGISSLIALTLSNLSRRLFGFSGQSSRRNAEPRTVAGRSSSPAFPPPEGIVAVTDTPSRLIAADMEEQPPIPPIRTKRAMRNVRYHVEMDYPRRQAGLGWISSDLDKPVHRKSELPFPGQFLVRAQAHEPRSPSAQMSVRGSFRSEGSGQSALHPSQSLATSSIMRLDRSSLRRSPFTFSQHVVTGRGLLSPVDRYRASSAMQIGDENFGSPSLLEQSLLQSRRELPLLRPIQQQRQLHQLTSMQQQSLPQHQHQNPFHQHIYQNIAPLAHSNSFLRATLPQPRAIRPIPYHPMRSSELPLPFGPHRSGSSLALRLSQRRRYDMKIAQIRRERETRAQLFNSRPPPSFDLDDPNVRLCQV